MFKKFISILLISFITFFLSAAEQPRIAVINFAHPPDISDSDALSLTRLFEGELIKTGAFRVIRYDNVATLLNSQAFSLGEFAGPEYAVKIGRLVAADHIITGQILKMENTWALNINLVKIETGQILKAASALTAEKENFLQEFPGLAAELSATGYKKPEIPFDDKIRVYVTMGDKYFKDGEFEKAVAQYDKALARDEWNLELLTKKVEARLENFLSRSLYHGQSISDGMDPALRNDYPFLHYIPGEELDEVQETIDLIRALDETRAADLSLVMMEVRLNKVGARADKALKAVEQAYKIAPDSSEVLAERGLLTAVRDYKKKDIGPFIRMIRRAIELEPETALYHLYLARTLERKGPRSDSLREYRLAAELATGQDFKTKRLREFALHSLQRSLYKLGGHEKGLLSPEIDMIPEERLEHLRYILDNEVRFRSKTATQNPEYFLGTLFLATGQIKEASGVLEDYFTEYTGPWSYRKDMLILYKKILEKGKHDPETLEKIKEVLEK